MAIRRSGHLEHTSHTTDDSPGNRPPIESGGTALGAHPPQTCAFFNSHDDQYSVLLHFIRWLQVGREGGFTSLIRSAP